MEQWVQIVMAVCSTITAIGVPLIALFMAVLNNKQAKAAKETEHVKETLAQSSADTKQQFEDLKESQSAVAEKVEEVHRATNSLTDRLVETTRTEAHAAGIKEGSEQKRPQPHSP